MRIRKHAKISPLLYTGSIKPGSSLLPSNNCLLNQSPWDVPSPPSDPATPPPLPLRHQVEADGRFTGNGSLAGSIGAVESVVSMKIRQSEGEAPKLAFNEARGGDEKDQLGLRKASGSCGSGGGTTVLCCRTDGKGWHCKRAVKTGHTLCDHHLVQLKNNSNLAHPTPTKSDKPPETLRRRPRPKKVSSSANPHEFYYYSGFGPLWGKKRGPGRAEPNKTIVAGNTIGHDISIDAAELVEPSPVVEVRGTHSSSQIDNEELDYVEDEDDNEEEGEKRGRKRTRKPIKARSLKSLM